MGHDAVATRSRVERKVLECIDATNESIRRVSSVERVHQAFVTKLDVDFAAVKQQIEDGDAAQAKALTEAQAALLTHIEQGIETIVGAVDTRVKVVRARCVADDRARAEVFAQFRGMRFVDRVRWLLFGHLPLAVTVAAEAVPEPSSL